MRGGTAIGVVFMIAIKGLSPLARGNLPDLRSASCSAGSIPACAGEPNAACALATSCGVYPRLRGGTRRSALFLWCRRGLSPLARGNRRGHVYPRAGTGSIPACAGEPIAIDPHPFSTRVYPRLRGGTMHGDEGSGKNLGLSPLARRNHVNRLQRKLPAGSIPACAGEPAAVRSDAFVCRVYPRLRGGTPSDALRYASQMGLSPLARGNPCLGVVIMALMGLSPLARGNPASSCSRLRAAGSIPACAGEPFLLLLGKGP